VSHEPGLRFWLRYAERGGALIEDGGDKALAVLPDSLQQETELPEEVTVTSDPDVAREDGAALLIAGHPALERAAATVLAEGDAARLHLPWPRSAPPTRGTLQARARERFRVDHGRIDAAGEPRHAYALLLRTGAMISYAASLAASFQEQEEAWVDARTALPVPDVVLESVRGRPRLSKPDARHPTLEADLALALAGAHARLEERATARRASLQAHSRRALESELARADAYYEGALESIERRRESAPADRQRLLDGQAEATRAERARRRTEIEQEFEASHEIRPFRLHLIHVPAFVLPVDIRRGSRTFPFEFTWLPAAAAFTDVRCPGCGEAADLVAGRERLGCESCLLGSPAPRRLSDVRDAAPSSPPLPGRGHSAKPSSGPRASDDRSKARANGPRKAAHTRPDRAARSQRRAPPPPRRRERARAPSRGGIERTGNKLALAFWQTVAGDERWPRKKTARHSPLSALFRLYGRAAPLCAIGIPPQRWPSEVTASTHRSTSGFPELTTGNVVASGISYPYTLYWWLHAGKPVAAELMPTVHPVVLSAAGLGDVETEARLFELAPAPCAQLDPVAAALWRVELSNWGMPIAARCLATWWRLEEAVGPAGPPAAVAAAVAGAVARAAGLRRRRAEDAEAYGADPDAMDRVARELGSRLRLDRARGW
jgi:hypothetical protein